MKISFNKIMEIEMFTLSQDIIPRQDYKTLLLAKSHLTQVDKIS